MNMRREETTAALWIRIHQNGHDVVDLVIKVLEIVEENIVVATVVDEEVYREDILIGNDRNVTTIIQQ